GAGVIASWAVVLVRDSGLVLLDADADPVLAREIRTFIQNDLGARRGLALVAAGPGTSRPDRIADQSGSDERRDSQVRAASPPSRFEPCYGRGGSLCRLR